MGHVGKNIGGLLITPKTIDQTGSVFTWPSREKQQRAMAFLNTQLFATPAWLIDQQLYDLASVDFSSVAAVQVRMLDDLLDPARINRLIEEETAEGARAYTAGDMLHDLQKGVFTEMATAKPIGVYRRNLQKAYVNRIIKILDSKGKASLDMGNDAMSILKAHAKELAAAIKETMARYPKSVTRSHLEDIYERLMLALKPATST
jgi:hypothetical protein